MKTIKTYESFLDIFKKKTNEDDNFIIEFINRLNKVKNNNPYNIEKIEQLPDWISYEYEKTPMYKVEFEDVNIIIKGIGYWINRRYSNENDSFNLYVYNDLGLREEIYSKRKNRMKLYLLIDNIYNNEKNKKRINNIDSEINPAADLL